MADAILKIPTLLMTLHRIMVAQRVWLVSLILFVSLLVFDLTQAIDSALFTGKALTSTAPFLILSIGIAAWSVATGADNLIAKAFTGSPFIMICLGALAGAISPFCSCGVIPLIAALLTMGVPLPAVMAFWLASPIMDPSMFVLTAGVLNVDFAIAKTIAAIGLGGFGGIAVHLLMKVGAFTDPLRDGITGNECGGSSVRVPKPVVWAFWADPKRRKGFSKTSVTTTLFLLKWLTLAFILESLIVEWVPAEGVSSLIGGQDYMTIVIATLLGIPAYMNGYAALPLVGGLIAQGMAPGAAMAFLIAGGVTSIPAAMAVWVLARPQVFALYITASLSGAFLAGLLYQLWGLL